MNRTTLVLLATAATLVGCPLPQPLPEYSPIANTPPRIVVDDSIYPVMQNASVDPPPRYRGTVVPVPASCSTAPLYDLDALIRDSNTIESIVVRWFVNYDYDPNMPAGPGVMPELQQTVGAFPAEPTLRDIGIFEFNPYAYHSDRITPGPGSTPGEVHVVELVVSNGFWTGLPDDEPLPNRSPAPGFEVQVYRWVFVNVQPAAAGGCLLDNDGNPVDPLCAECPI